MRSPGPRPALAWSPTTTADEVLAGIGGGPITWDVRREARAECELDSGSIDWEVWGRCGEAGTEFKSGAMAGCLSAMTLVLFATKKGMLSIRLVPSERRTRVLRQAKQGTALPAAIVDSDE